MRSIEAKAVISATDKTGSTFQRVADKIKRLEDASTRVNRASSAVSRSGMSAMAAIGRFAAPAALAAGVVAVSKNFAGYDRQLSYLGNTADATADQMAAVRKEISATSREVAETPDEVLKGTQTFIAALGDIETATKATRETARAAKAFGADIEDQASAGVAVVQNLGIQVERLNRANEIMAAGANIGMFEPKDMAKHLPSISAAAKELKVVGEGGLGKLVAHLEVVRTATGDSATAANDYYNFLSKIVAPGTIDAIEDMAKEQKKNVDLLKEIDKGYKNGADGVETFLRVVKELTNGDPAKIKELVPDMQANRALTALMSQYDQLDSKIKTVLDSVGLVDKSLKRVMADQQTGLDKLTQAWDRLFKIIGEKSGFNGGSGVVADVLNNVADNFERTPEQWRDLQREQQRDEAQGNISAAHASVKRKEAHVAAIDEELARIDLEMPEYAKRPWGGVTAKKDAEERARRLRAQRETLTGGPSAELQRERMRVFELEQQLRLFDMDPHGVGGFTPNGPADQSDRMRDRDSATAAAAASKGKKGEARRGAPLPTSVPAPFRLPSVGDDAGGFGGPIKAVVDGPVTAQVSGQADVQVTVKVEPSPQFLATVDRLEKAASMPLRSAPTGRSMTEAEPPSRGSSGGIGSR